MIIQAWALISTVITPPLIAGGGFWLRNLVNEQLKSKDATIESLNAAIKLHEAAITGLKGERAPAIAADYKAMLEHANQKTEENQRLKEQMKDLTEDQKKVMNSLALQSRVAEIDGLLLANDLMLNEWNAHFAENEDFQGDMKDFYRGLLSRVTTSMDRIDKEIDTRRMEIARALT